MFWRQTLSASLVPLAEQHTAAQHLTGDGEADAAAARAQVEHTAVRAGVQLVDDRLHQHLGVGAWDEHGGRNIQPKAVKLPLADKIGHRLASKVPRAQGIRRTLDLGRGVEQPVAQKLIFSFCPTRCRPARAPPASRPPRPPRAGACAGPYRGRCT